MGIEDWNYEQKVIKKDRPQDEEKKMSRRKFLKRSAAAGGAAIVGGGLLKKGMDYLNDSSNNNKVTENKEAITVPESNENKELSEAEKITTEMLRVFESPAIKRRIDSKIFTNDFYMAQQFQESRGAKDVESGDEAKGVYQVRSGATKYIIDYLNHMERRTEYLPEGQKIEFDGPKEISKEEADAIGDMYKKKVNHGRAAGKLYLLAIHDKDSKYNSGKSEDVFRGKSVKEQQKLLLLSYFCGPTMRLHPERAGKGGRHYVESVFDYMETIADLRNRLEKAGMSRELNYAIEFILKELDRGENKNSENNPKAREDAINFWVKKLQDEHMELWQKTGNPDERISNSKIWEIFPKD